MQKKYVQSFLEVIYDKTLANLKIDLKGRGINIDEVDAADSREALAATATELMKNTFGLLKKSDNKESAILEKAKKYIDENFSSDFVATGCSRLCVFKSGLFQPIL